MPPSPAAAWIAPEDDVARGNLLGAAAVAAQVARDGIGIWRGDGWEDEFYDGYHTTLHSHAYMREHWSRWAEVVAIDEAAALPVQDIAVLRRRPAP